MVMIALCSALLAVADRLAQRRSGTGTGGGWWWWHLDTWAPSGQPRAPDPYRLTQISVPAALERNGQ
jgi:hypothetical protein